jgi:hypothetical protein
VEIAQGNSALVQSLLAGILLAWIFLPLSITPAGISLRSFLHLPLSTRDLFTIRVAALLITPYSWLVVAGSLAISYPLAHAPSPWAAISAGLLFIATSLLIGLAISHLIGIAYWRRLLFVVLLLLGAVAVYTFTLKGDATLHSFAALPTGLVTLAATGQNAIPWLGALLLLTALALLAAWWSFRFSLANAQKARFQRKSDSILFFLPGAAGRFAVKDVRYFRRLLDPYFGLLASLLCSVYLLSAKEPSLSVVCVFIIIVFMPSAPLAFNSFGLDTRFVLDRYALMPARGATILRGKNLAMLVIISLQVLPIILLAYWRLGLSAGVLGIVETISLAAAYLAWGNWMSIALPAKMHFFRFAPSGSLPELFAGVIFSSSPGVVVVYFLQTSTGHAIAATLFMFLVFGTIFLFVTRQAGKRFDKQREKIVRAIS